MFTLLKTILRRARVLAATTAIALLFGTQVFAQEADFTAPDGLEAVPGELIVKFKPTVTSALGARALANAGIESVKTFEIINASLVRISDTNVAAAADRISALAEVEYAEPNYIVYATKTPNDPDFPDQWALPKINAPDAWDIRSDSPDVVVAVIDTGVDYDHPDLKANMWKNAGEIPGNGIDDDGNGVIDDVHGANFIPSTPSGDPMDDNRHGSHVAGIISAVTDNNLGIAGASWKTQIMALKFLSASGSGSIANAIECIEYATKNGAHIMNNSWGGGGFSQAAEDAIKAANSAGILFTAAAGNSNNDNDANPHFPSNYEVENVLSVMATDQSDNRAGFSNFGLKTVDLGAPGVKILSTVPRGGYQELSGTSMATPYVSGAAALVKAENPTWGPVKIKQHLMDTADKIPALNGLSVSGARLNLLAALKGGGGTPPPPPPPPGEACESDNHALIAYNEFFWSEGKTVSANENLLDVSFSLPESMVIDISINGSANRTEGNGTTTIRTGVYNQSNPSVMWTGSYRKLSFDNDTQSLPLTSNFSTRLPAGDHTMYWKLWISGATLKLDSGTITVRAFPCSMGGKIESAADMGNGTITAVQSQDIATSTREMDGSDN